MDNVIPFPVHKTYLNILILTLEENQLLFKAAQGNNPHKKTVHELIAVFITDSYIIIKRDGLHPVHRVRIGSCKIDSLVRIAHGFDVIKDIYVFV